jgi:hypothetical protein
MNLARLDANFVVLALVVFVALVLLVMAYERYRQGARLKLRERFGPEYERAVKEQGSQRRAEAQLASREKRVDQFNLRELGAIERERFVSQWNALQLRFVDSPRGAVAEADDLVMLLMKARGYPIGGFEQRAADLSVDHPVVVNNYRAAHVIAMRLRKGQASTEDLRNAMIHYRTLFDEMIHITPAGDRRNVA